MIKNNKITGQVKSNRLLGRVLTKLLGLDFIWNGTKLGVKKENETEYQFADLEGPEGPRGQQRITRARWSKWLYTGKRNRLFYPRGHCMY